MSRCELNIPSSASGRGDDTQRGPALPLTLPARRMLHRGAPSRSGRLDSPQPLGNS